MTRLKKVYKVTTTEAGSKKQIVTEFINLRDARGYGFQMRQLGLLRSLKNQKGVLLPLK